MTSTAPNSKFATIAVTIGFAALIAVPLILYRGGEFQGRELLDDQGNVVGREYLASTSLYRDRYLEATILLTEGDEAAAEAIYRELVKLEPGNPNAFIGLAGAQVGQSNLAAARENYARALELDPKNPEAFYGAGAVERMEGDPKTAKAYYQQALSISPDHGLSHFGMAKSCNELGDKQLAIHHAARFLELYPDSALRKEMSEILAGKD